MRTKEGFKLRKMAGEYIVVGEGRSRVNFNKMIVLNKTAGYLWEQVEGKDFDARTLAGLLMEQYEIDEPTALRDSEALAAKWVEAGIAEE